MQENLIIHYVETDESLVSLCQLLSKSDVLAVDTEFVRTRTYYPKLGLLQVNNGEHLALIDPISINDLSPFWQLISSPNILKVLHACSEDLEVFLSEANCKPQNLIDSQVMMSFLGHGLSLGYAAMIEHFVGVKLDKSESRTDWTKRPLTARQLEYARADVKYLSQVFPTLMEQLEASGWLEAARQETQLMIDKKFTPIAIDKLYRNIKMAWRLSGKQLNTLKHLATWRIQQARERDMPVGFIAKDHTLLALAQHNPTTLSVMTNIEGIELLDVRHRGKTMLKVLRQADQTSEAEYPSKVIRLDELPRYKQIFKQIKNFVSTVAKANNLQPEVLASKKQINQFLECYYKLNDNSENIDILRDWRLALFGKDLQGLAKNNFN